MDLPRLQPQIYDPSSVSSIDSSRQSSLSLSLSRALVIISFLSQIVVAFRFWALTWDDSAITLSFAQTFAHTGRIELTPGSGIVEGYSTTLWMLIMAAFAKILSAPSALLVAAKLSTLLLNLANILLIRRWFLSWTSETVANLIAGGVGGGLMFYETINGMETPLILFLVLAMLLLFPRKDRTGRICYLLAGSAFLLTRWEAAWLLVPFVLIERDLRRALGSSITWLTVFGASNFIRWRYFGSILPNTVIAKHGVPYTKADPVLERLRHIQEPAFILGSCKVFLIIILAGLLYEYFFPKQNRPLFSHLRSGFHDSWQLRFCLLFTLFSLVLSTVIGTNFGPEARSFYSAWPFLFALVLLPLAIMRPTTQIWASTGVCLFCLLRLFVHVQELRDKNAPIYMPHSAVGDVAVTASMLSEVQSATHQSHLVFAGPDMGAVGLYSSNIEVIDLGLLCDATLAHQRYAAVEPYVLEQRQPDVIEVHDNWTQLSGLQDDPLFLKNFRPVYINGNRIFLTRRLIADIDPSSLTQMMYKPDGTAGVEARPISSKPADRFDRNLNRAFGTYLVLK